MEKNKSLTERIIKGSTTAVILTGLATPVSYLIKMLYSRNLSIEMFGLFFAVLAFFMLIASITDLGFGYSVTYLVPKYYNAKKYQECWNLYQYNFIVNLTVSIGVSIFILLTGKILSEYYFKSYEAQKIIYIFIIYLVGNGLISSIDKIFLGLQQEKYYAAIQTVRNVLSLLLSILFWVINNANIMFFSLAWAVSTLITFFIFYSLMKNHNPKLVRQTTWDRKLFNEMRRLALPSLITVLLYLLTNSISIIFLTIFRGVSDVGIYSIVAALATISNIVLTPINIFFFPLISHLMEDQKDKIQKIFYNGMEIIPFIGLYFALFIVLFPAQTISTLFGSKWVELSKFPLILFSFIYIGTQTSNFLSTLIQGLGEINKLMRASIIVAIVNIIGSYFLIRTFGVEGAILASGATFVIAIYLYSRIINSSFKIKFPTIKYFKYFVASSLIFLAFRLLGIDPNGLVQYLILGLLYTIIMIVLAYILDIVDISMVKSFLKN